MPLQIQSSNLVGYWPMDDGPDGISADGDTIRDLSGNGNNGTGDDGANNTGLTWKAEEVLSYPWGALSVVSPSVVSASISPFRSDLENVSALNEIEKILQLTQLENVSEINELQLVKT